jgi:hypothetical protein
VGHPGYHGPAGGASGAGAGAGAGAAPYPVTPGVVAGYPAGEGYHGEVPSGPGTQQTTTGPMMGGAGGWGGPAPGAAPGMFANEYHAPQAPPPAHLHGGPQGQAPGTAAEYYNGPAAGAAP